LTKTTTLRIPAGHFWSISGGISREFLEVFLEVFLKYFERYWSTLCTNQLTKAAALRRTSAGHFSNLAILTNQTQLVGLGSSFCLFSETLTLVDSGDNQVALLLVVSIILL